MKPTIKNNQGAFTFFVLMLVLFTSPYYSCSQSVDSSLDRKSFKITTMEQG